MRNVRGVRVVGGTFPSQIFKAFMTTALADVPEHEFPVPTDSFVTVVLGYSRDCVARLGQPGVEVTMPITLIPTRDCAPYSKPSPKPSGSASASPTATAAPNPSPSPEPQPTGT